MCNFFQLLVESLFCWLFFPFQSLIKKVLICSLHLLNNKNLECGHTSKKRSKLLYAGFLHIPFQHFVGKSIDLKQFHVFGRIFVLLVVFPFQPLIKKVLICSIYLLNNKNFTSKKKIQGATHMVSTYSFSIFH